MADKAKSAEKVAREIGGISAESVRQLADTKPGELLREDQVTWIKSLTQGS